MTTEKQINDVSAIDRPPRKNWEIEAAWAVAVIELCAIVAFGGLAFLVMRVLGVDQ